MIMICSTWIYVVFAVKRAAESIIYGNHQNNARSRNTGPAMHLDSQKAKKSSVDVNPVPVDSTANEATENNNDVANELPQDENKELATDINNDNLILQKAEGEEEGQLSSLVNNGQQTESGLNEEESSGDEGDSLPNNPNAGQWLTLNFFQETVNCEVT